MTAKATQSTGYNVMHSYDVLNSWFYNEHASYSGIFMMDSSSNFDIIREAEEDRVQIEEYNRMAKEWCVAKDGFVNTSLETIWHKYQGLKQIFEKILTEFRISFFLTWEGSLQFIASKDRQQIIVELFFEDDKIEEFLFMKFDDKRIIHEKHGSGEEFGEWDPESEFAELA